MFAGGKEQTPEIHQTFAIQLQRHDGCPARRRQPQNFCPVLAPGEMIAPVMVARMKKGNRFTGNRVRCHLLVVFMIVATLTGKCEMVGNARAASVSWLDVFDGK